MLRQAEKGCSHAPRPESLRCGSGTIVTVSVPSPVEHPHTTILSSSGAGSRFRQPTHVRTGATGRRSAADSSPRSRSVTEDSDRTSYHSTADRCVPSNPAPDDVARTESTRRVRWSRVTGRADADSGSSVTGDAPPFAPRPRRPGPRRCGYRSASRSAGPRGGRSAPPCRWPARAGNPGRSPGRPGRPGPQL